MVPGYAGLVNLMAHAVQSTMNIRGQLLPDLLKLIALQSSTLTKEERQLPAASSSLARAIAAGFGDVKAQQQAQQRKTTRERALAILRCPAIGDLRAAELAQRIHDQDVGVTGEERIEWAVAVVQNSFGAHASDSWPEAFVPRPFSAKGVDPVKLYIDLSKLRDPAHASPLEKARHSLVRSRGPAQADLDPDSIQLPKWSLFWSWLLRSAWKLHSTTKREVPRPEGSMRALVGGRSLTLGDALANWRRVQGDKRGAGRTDVFRAVQQILAHNLLCTLVPSAGSMFVLTTSKASYAAVWPAYDFDIATRHP